MSPSVNTGHPSTLESARHEKELRPMSDYWKVALPIIAGAALLLIPVPEGLKPMLGTTSRCSSR
jgi:hypothetical protein